MKVTNSAPYPVIAFTEFVPHGFGEDTRIEPGETEDVPGPLVRMIGGEQSHVILEGAITCEDKPASFFYVSKGVPLYFYVGKGNIGLLVRHHLDPLEERVSIWREKHRKTA